MIKTALIFLLAGCIMLFVTPLGFLACILSVLGLRKLMLAAVYQIAQGWSLLLIKATGCTVTVSGRERVPRKGGLCLVSNHGSIFDIILALAYTGRPFGFIAKKELLLIPFLNVWVYILGGLFIDRSHPRKALLTINEGIRRLKAGDGILIFPEGHRSRGQGLLPFKPGSFKLAAQSGAPIIPMAISGSYEVFEKTYRVAARPVSLTFCEPVNPLDFPAGDRKQALSDRVRNSIEQALEA